MNRIVRLKNQIAVAVLLVLAGALMPQASAQGDETSTPPVADTNVVEDSSVALNFVTNEDGVMEEEQPPQNWRGPVVVVGGSATLKTKESADVVVAVGGTARAGGKVRDAVVAIGGDAHADSDVGAAVVAIGGNANARGRVQDAVVAIAGDASAQGEVEKSVVAVFGDVNIGSNSVVHGDAVAIGGEVKIENGGKVNGRTTNVGMGDYPLLAPLKGMVDWVKHCVFKVRLLAPQPGWYWVVAGLFLLCYLFITVAFRRPVEACLHELTHRPATTFLLGLLTKLLVPLLVVVLALTGIGVIVVPFVGAAMFIGSMIGKAALFQFLGRQSFRLFGGQLPNAVLAMLVGFALITLLYMVPVLSLLVYLLTGIWGIGAAVTACFGGARKESPPRSNVAPPPAAGWSAEAPGASPAAAMAATAAGFAAASTPDLPSANPHETTPGATPSAAPPPSADAGAGFGPKPATGPSAPPVMLEAMTLPRASFWERMGAGFLDMIIVGIVVGLLPHIFEKLFSDASLLLFVALGYSAGMWTWKGTTIGGIVLNLKVVRLDDQPVTFAVALVRGLAAALSFVVLFLGFFWMIWDGEKQTWHDKIAGTVVVRQPRGTPLICL